VHSVECKSTPTWKAKLLWITSHYGPGVDNYIGSSSWDWRQANDPVPWILISGTQNKYASTGQTVEDYHCAKCRVVLIRSFRFIMLKYPHTHTPTHTHTAWQRDRYIAAPYYVVRADNNENKKLSWCWQQARRV